MVRATTVTGGRFRVFQYRRRIDGCGENHTAALKR